MATPEVRRLALAHIEGERRLRYNLRAASDRLWDALPDYSDDGLDLWLRRIVPWAVAGQRQSIALTEAYLARALGTLPGGVDREAILANLRNGADPAEVYRRPFVTVWTGLKQGVDYLDAVAAGRARAATTIATDVQLAMRDTLMAVADG